jgi:hypothetical protein
VVAEDARDLDASGRVRLARLAGQVIDRTDGVTATSGPAGRWQTVAAQQTIPGVLAVEDPQGRVEVELHLVALWPPQVPLEQLGEQVRGDVRRSAATAGMAQRLGAVAISFDDVQDEGARP